jgi:hypothetical protein
MSVRGDGRGSTKHAQVEVGDGGVRATGDQDQRRALDPRALESMTRKLVAHYPTFF